MNCLILLSGCGLGDGSCIEEVILTYTVLDKRHCAYTPTAQDMEVPSIDHQTEQQGGSRNVLTESARIGRGFIQDISAIDCGEYDALIIPGGIGLLRHYRDSEAVRSCLRHFLDLGKPVATMCAGIDFLRALLGQDLLRQETAELSAVDFCSVKEKNIYYTPTFRKSGSCYEVMLGLDAMVSAMIQAI